MAKYGQSLRDTGIDATSLAEGFHEGVFINYSKFKFGISGQNRLNAIGNKSRPTKIDGDILSVLLSLSEDDLVRYTTVKYAGTPVNWAPNAKTERQRQKNSFLRAVFPNSYEKVFCECFGGGIFGINDPIGLGVKFRNLLCRTIICIQFDGTKKFESSWDGYKVIVSPPRRISPLQSKILKDRINRLDSLGKT